MHEEVQLDVFWLLNNEVQVVSMGCITLTHDKHRKLFPMALICVLIQPCVKEIAEVTKVLLRSQVINLLTIHKLFLRQR